jgi:hypothetical protein
MYTYIYIALYICTYINRRQFEIDPKYCRQKLLDFQKVSPEATKVVEEEDYTKYRMEKEKQQSIKKEIAENWGLPWPQQTRKDARKGGPLPRQHKWEEGLYQWIGKIAKDESPKPDTPPSLQFPNDWQHKTCPVWDYHPLVKVPKAEEDEDPGPPPLIEEDENEPAEGEGAAVKQKRAYHAYPEDVRQVYFDFEKQMGGPRSKVVAFVKHNYPSLFPPTFNECRPREWERAMKKTDGPGKGWRLGEQVLGAAHLAFLGAIIMAQYTAGVPMTSKLLVPLIFGALVGKGYADQVGGWPVLALIDWASFMLPIIWKLKGRRCVGLRRLVFCNFADPLI